MLRKLWSGLRAGFNQPDVQLMIAGIAISTGVRILVETVTSLREEMTQLAAEIRAERAQVAELEYAAAAPVSPDVYPTDNDLNPLPTGE